ncbi:response regulator transcription factor [Acidovorax sp.]|uniref:response regulator n=1 Tax=Acidovorax sp. TaxID=1872122 RepID=UPI0026310304|nr:response regulator transcription factor [Acidovorax sp.]
MKHILLVDDLADALAMLQDAIVAAFGPVPCTQARCVREALTVIDSGTPFDLALIDLALGDGSGLDLIGRLAQSQPQCAVVVASIHDDDDHLFQALQAGAQGYLLKDHPTAWLALQLQGIAQGQPPLSPAIARRLLRHFQPPPAAQAPTASDLSARERDVLGLLAQGVRIADIGIALGISRHTVGDHVKNIYRKLNISSRAEAALQARQLGLI